MARPLLAVVAVLPALLGTSVAAHETVHCTLAYAGGATWCDIDLVPGWCADPDMTLSGFCLGSATAHRSHAPLPIVVEEVVAYVGGAVPVLAYALLRSRQGGSQGMADRAEPMGAAERYGPAMADQGGAGHVVAGAEAGHETDVCGCMRRGIDRGRRACAAMGRCGGAPVPAPERQ